MAFMFFSFRAGAGQLPENEAYVGARWFPAGTPDPTAFGADSRMKGFSASGLLDFGP
jgi:hypothetical protein